jgi:hypothetical protein
MRIVNILAQPVVFPGLYAGSGTTAVPPSLAGHSIVNMTLPCGAYMAYWDGKAAASGREAPSGVYGIELFVDGQKMPGTAKVFHSK